MVLDLCHSLCLKRHTVPAPLCPIKYTHVCINHGNCNGSSSTACDHECLPLPSEGCILYGCDRHAIAVSKIRKGAKKIHVACFAEAKHIPIQTKKDMCTEGFRDRCGDAELQQLARQKSTTILAAIPCASVDDTSQISGDHLSRLSCEEAHHGMPSLGRSFDLLRKLP